MQDKREHYKTEHGGWPIEAAEKGAIQTSS
jgi:hypothetical protein